MFLSIAPARKQSFNNGTFTPIMPRKNEEKTRVIDNKKRPANEMMSSRIEEDSSDDMDFILLDPRHVFGVSQHSSGRSCRPLLLPRPPLRSIVTNHAQHLETNGMSFIPISPDPLSFKNEEAQKNKKCSPLNLEVDTHVNAETTETPKRFSSSRNNKNKQPVDREHQLLSPPLIQRRRDFSPSRNNKKQHVDREQSSLPLNFPQRRREGSRRKKMLPLMPMW
jgi:hypothetical protein